MEEKNLTEEKVVEEIMADENLVKEALGEVAPDLLEEEKIDAILEEEVHPAYPPFLTEEKNGGIKVTYRLTKEQVISAMKYADKKKNFVKRCILTAILVFLGIYFLVAEAVMPVAAENKLFVGILCLAVGVFYWFVPTLEQKYKARAFEETDDAFVLSVYHDGISVGAFPTEEFFPYNEMLKVVENDRFMLFDVYDAKLFCLDKKAIEACVVVKIQEMLEKGLFEKCYQKNLKK